ncbi:MAG: hypothetical protein GY821_03070 [Gammaproteobacteria bacterium]|nr:hypothetical protein [Gammaproteobacteria bacterium]
MYDIRRQHHIEFAFRQGINQLFESVIDNLQIFTQRGIIHYQGDSQQKIIQLNSQSFSLYQKKLFRLMPSNKLPLVIDG